jgi:molybdopterin converting factor small subunit
MRVTVKLFSLLREPVGNKTVDVDLHEGPPLKIS